MSHEPISEDWLKSVGFKWHQFDRQPDKHWLLWLGGGLRQRPSLTDMEDLGIEIAPCYNGEWFCWLRSDMAGRYHRFIHLRHIATRADLIQIVEAISGRPWTPENHLYGSLRSPESAARIRADMERLDRRLMLASPKWSDIEEDDTRGRALPEHMTKAISGGVAK
ncbi:MULTISPECIES: hypothetical protein [unclassified Bradyrhizobium]|uniref:hypothetical protein n=1 Tax=unclassified Bradyrhizobium TaxID=2631580 RepID=UPI0028E304F2|nr:MULTISPECIES: hypothetical protein [unclassified Bradyrhizobium]